MFLNFLCARRMDPQQGYSKGGVLHEIYSNAAVTYDSGSDNEPHSPKRLKKNTHDGGPPEDRGYKEHDDYNKQGEHHKVERGHEYDKRTEPYEDLRSRKGPYEENYYPDASFRRPPPPRGMPYQRDRHPSQRPYEDRPPNYENNYRKGSFDNRRGNFKDTRRGGYDSREQGHRNFVERKAPFEMKKRYEDKRPEDDRRKPEDRGANRPSNWDDQPSASAWKPPSEQGAPPTSSDSQWSNSYPPTESTMYHSPPRHEERNDYDRHDQSNFKERKQFKEYNNVGNNNDDFRGRPRGRLNMEQQSVSQPPSFRKRVIKIVKRPTVTTIVEPKLETFEILDDWHRLLMEMTAKSVEKLVLKANESQQSNEQQQSQSQQQQQLPTQNGSEVNNTRNEDAKFLNENYQEYNYEREGENHNNYHRESQQPPHDMGSVEQDIQRQLSHEHEQLQGNNQINPEHQYNEGHHSPSRQELGYEYIFLTLSEQEIAEANQSKTFYVRSDSETKQILNKIYAPHAHIIFFNSQKIQGYCKLSGIQGGTNELTSYQIERIFLHSIYFESPDLPKGIIKEELYAGKQLSSEIAEELLYKLERVESDQSVTVNLTKRKRNDNRNTNYIPNNNYNKYQNGPGADKKRFRYDNNHHHSNHQANQSGGYNTHHNNNYGGGHRNYNNNHQYSNPRFSTNNNFYDREDRNSSSSSQNNFRDNRTRNEPHWNSRHYPSENRSGRPMDSQGSR